MRSALVLVDLGQELGLGAAGTGGVSLCRGHGDVLEVQFRREQAAGAVGQLDRQRPSEHPGRDQVTGDGGESEPLPGRAVHPVAEPLVADAEGEPAEQRRAVPGIVVELLGKLDGPVDRLDDDPLVLRCRPAAVP